MDRRALLGCGYAIALVCAGCPAIRVGAGSTQGSEDGAPDASDAPDGGGGDNTTVRPMEICDNGLDDDGNGLVDDGCPCTPAETRSCYAGGAPYAEVGECLLGAETCVGPGEFGAWSDCAGGRGPGPEVCDNGLDDDCDGLVDRDDPDCPSCIEAGDTAWQIHAGAGPTCLGRSFARHGDPALYAYSSIPDSTDPGWAPHTDPNISFDAASTLCAFGCACLQAADFTYFQTFFDIPSGYVVSSLIVTIVNVDDGVAVTIFNSRFPAGVTDPGAYAYLGGGSTSDLASYVVPGTNRIVLTHVDDCCAERRIANATVTMNGGALVECTTPTR